VNSDRELPVTSPDPAGPSAAPFSCAAGEVLGQLHSDAALGLAADVVQSRQDRFGLNQIAEPKRTPAWLRLLAQFRQLVIGILLAAAVIAGAMGEWTDTVTILAIVLLNGVLGFAQEEKAEQALAALRALSAPLARIIRQGTTQTLPARELVPGDVLLLEAGDQVPADARLLESFSLTVQEASLTGESLPVTKDAGSVLVAETPLADRQNMVYTGTVVASGKGTAVVTATGMSTELGSIAALLGQTPSEPTPLQRRLSELGRILVVVCLALVAVIFGLQYWRGGQLMETLLVAVSLAVAAVPEGLPAVVTISLAIGLQRMVKRNALVRKLPSVETLGSVTVICSDKTGTLTRNEMTVRKVCTATQSWDVTGTGYQPRGQLVPSDGPVDGSFQDLQQLLTIASHCNSATLQSDETGNRWTITGDPTEGALIVLAHKGGIPADRGPRRLVSEIPFDSERKAMSVIERTADQRLVLYHKGAPEVVLEKCTQEWRQGQPHPLSADRKRDILNISSQMAGQALRVLAFAFLDDPPQRDGQYQETDLVFAGLAGMIDPPREEVRQAVDECFEAGIRPVMITGDHPETALAIGRELRIADGDARSVTGPELDRMDDDELRQRVDRIPVYARVSAAHKLRVIQAWKHRGQVVAMTGDGVNDAPAIKTADIGIAMGITGTDVTKQAADMVLMDDNFASIVNAVREGRGIFDNIQKFVHYLLSCNAGEVLLMFVAALCGYPVPLLAVQILWINLVTDGLPALALALEPPEKDIMQRAPRPPREPVITWQGGLLILYHGALIAAVAMLGFAWVYENNPENLPVARATAFGITALSQLAFALVCRSHRFTLPQLGLFTNRWLFVAFVLSGLLQLGVMTLPVTQRIFEVHPVSIDIWLRIIGLSLVPATIIEVAKILWSMWQRPGARGKNRSA
jgi:Ca2+-transporting ATPase